MAHPDVLEAAVIAVPDEQWSERPCACVVAARRLRRSTPTALRAFLDGPRRQVVAARARRVHRRGPQDLGRQVRQEGPARPLRRAGGERAAVTTPSSRTSTSARSQGASTCCAAPSCARRCFARAGGRRPSWCCSATCVELRDGPVRAGAAARPRPFFEELGEAMAGRRVVLVPGNHDHRLIAAWLERAPDRRDPPRARARRAHRAARGLGRRRRCSRGWLGRTPARARLPGPVAARRRLRDPRPLPRPPRDGPGLRADGDPRSCERLLRARGGRPPAGRRRLRGGARPLYGLLHEWAQSVARAGTAPRRGRVAARRTRRSRPTTAAARSPGALRRGRRPTRRRSPRSTASGSARCSADLSGAELRRAGLLALGEVAAPPRRPGRARDLRPHPPRRPAAPTTTRASGAHGGARIVNTGSWVYEPFYLGPTPRAARTGRARS